MTIDTDNTKRITGAIESKIGEPVQKVDIAGMAKGYKGFYCFDGKRVRIEVDCSQPAGLAEAVFVHEGLHVLLLLEGYPGVTVNSAKAANLEYEAMESIKAAFQSVIDHPEVIRRMASEFDLEMEPYLDMEAQQKQLRLEEYAAKPSTKKDIDYWFCRQQDILWGLDYYNFGKAREESLLKTFSSQFPDACRYCKKLYGQVGQRLSTPHEALSSAKLIRTQIKLYAKKNNASAINNYWDALGIEPYVVT